MRPATPDDADAIQEFMAELSPEARYNRFFSAFRRLPDSLLDRFTHSDRRNLVLLAFAEDRIVAIGQYAETDDRDTCELGVVVADDWRRRGLGLRLVEALTERALAAGFERMSGEVLADNAAMLALAGKAGFASYEGAAIAHIVRPLYRRARVI